MISLIKRIFGSPDILKESVSLVRDAGDALFYTEEEKAQDRMRRAEQVDKLLIDWMDSTKGQNLSRRLIAFMITVIWLLMYILAFFVDIAAVWADPEQAILLRETSAAMGTYGQQMNGAMMLILGFYFAAPHLGKVVDGAMAKFSGKTKSGD